MRKHFKKRHYQLIFLVSVVIIIAFAVMSKFFFKKENVPVNDLKPTGTSAITDTLSALSYTPKEIKIYNYFLFYSPATLVEAKAGVNFPKDLIDADLIAGAHKLERDGFLVQDKNNRYETTGIEFLIQKTNSDPKFSELNRRLRNWQQKAIE